MYRYSFLFLEEYRAHAPGDGLPQLPRPLALEEPVLGHMLGSLFLRSYERGERVYVAMLSRGYEGTIRQPHWFRRR